MIAMFYAFEVNRHLSSFGSLCPQETVYVPVLLTQRYSSLLNQWEGATTGLLPIETQDNGNPQKQEPCP